MNRIFLVVLLAMFWVDRSFGEVHSIDKTERECIEKDSSTTGMLNCTVKAQEEWDTELNKYYQLLMKDLDQEQKDRLREAQQAWIKFRDAEFKNIHSFYATKVGTMYLNLESADKLAVVKQRAKDLKIFYDFLKIDSE